MPVTMEPCENGHVLRFFISEPWTAREMASVYPASRAYHDKAPHKVHSLLIVEARQVPPGLLQLRQGPPSLVHPNSGQTVVVGAGAVIRTISEVIFKILRYDRGKFFNTEEEALAYLRQVIDREVGESQRVAP
jgi:hypothetical protein